jgi:adenylate cyclase class IV
LESTGSKSRRSESLGATKTFDGDEETLFFDFPGSPIAKEKDLLRLRKIDEKTVLAFKEFVNSETAKVREEHEVSVSGFEPMRLIPESLGLCSTHWMEKRRTSYVLKGGVTVDIERYTGEFSHIPDLVEIEGGYITIIRSFAKLLRFQPEECKSRTTFDLIDHYSEKKVKT